MIEDHSNKILTALIGGFVGGVTWLFRTVVTNQKQIAMQGEKLNNLHDDVMEIKRENRQAVKNQATIIDIVREIRDAKN